MKAGGLPGPLPRAHHNHRIVSYVHVVYLSMCICILCCWLGVQLGPSWVTLCYLDSSEALWRHPIGPPLVPIFVRSVTWNPNKGHHWDHSSWVTPFRIGIVLRSSTKWVEKWGSGKPWVLWDLLIISFWFELFIYFKKETSRECEYVRQDERIRDFKPNPPPYWGRGRVFLLH